MYIHQEVKGSEKMVAEYIKNIIEENGFENPVQIAVPHWLAEEKNIKSTLVMDLISETQKAIQIQEVQNDYGWEGEKHWLPKSQIEVTEI